MSDSSPLSSFTYISESSRLVEVLETLKSALKARANGLDGQIESLIDHLGGIITEQSPKPPQTMTEIGEFGSHLLEKLYFESLENIEHQRMFNFLALAFAYWVARNGGSITQLQFYVAALAQTANSLRDKISLESLYEAATFIVFATSDELKTAPEVAAPDDPWKVLILNYGIIATRTHAPELMESAYKTLIQYFPDEAPPFFQQAMSEMDRLDYPQYVRNVVERYCAKYTTK